MEQIRNEIIQDNNNAISALINSLDCLNIDFGTRINMLENSVSRRKDIINNKLLNRNAVRINYIENSMNNIETEIKKIRKQMARKYE